MTDEKRAEFKRQEYEAMRGIVAGDFLCPDPAAHMAVEPDGPCEHVSSTYGPCTVVGRHKRAAGLIHVYEARPLVIGGD